MCYVAEHRTESTKSTPLTKWCCLQLLLLFKALYTTICQNFNNTSMFYGAREKNFVYKFMSGLDVHSNLVCKGMINSLVSLS